MFIDKVFTCVMYKQQEHQVTVSYIHINIHLLVYNTIQLCKQHYLLAQELDFIGFINQRKRRSFTVQCAKDQHQL